MSVTAFGIAMWLLFLVIWGGLRLAPNKRARRNTVSVSKRSPKEWISLAAAFSGFLVIPLVWVVTGWPSALDHGVAFWSLILGGAAFTASLWLIYRTHKDLGRQWSNSLELREDHKLVDTGIYTHLRHPMYSAFWLQAFGQALVLGNWLAGLAGIVGFGILFFLRVGDEEAMMGEAFGDAYQDYMARTKRVIPWVY